jgi:hypothetical protein
VYETDGEEYHHSKPHANMEIKIPDGFIEYGFDGDRSEKACDNGID